MSDSAFAYRSRLMGVPPDSGARLAPQLASLFPLGAVAAEVSAAGDPRLLHPAEREHVREAAAKRVSEFAAGRACARRALAELGIVNFTLLPLPSRQPVWPPAVSGSITHTAGYAAAVVARTSDIRSLGVDSEVIAAVDRDLWATLFTAAEVSALNAATAAAAAAAAAMFAAKEAFYKCQYPLTLEWVDFHDVEVRLVNGGGTQCGFELQPRRRLQLQQLYDGPLTGRYRVHAGLVTAGIALC